MTTQQMTIGNIERIGSGRKYSKGGRKDTGGYLLRHRELTTGKCVSKQAEEITSDGEVMPIDCKGSRMKLNPMVTQMVNDWKKSGMLVFPFCKKHFEDYGYSSPQTMSGVIHKRIGRTRPDKPIVGLRRQRLLMKYGV